MTIPADKRNGEHQLDIVVRRIPFELSEGIDPVWNPDKPEWSHMINGASLTMPYLEQYLNKSIREALPKKKDKALRVEARKLAYTAGFETMTIGVTDWLIKGRRKLFAGADPRVVSFVLWHMVEETEHKSVAIDVYRALFPSDYLARVRGLFWGSIHVGLLSRRGYIAMLKKDGKWSD